MGSGGINPDDNSSGGDGIDGDESHNCDRLDGELEYDASGVVDPG